MQARKINLLLAALAIAAVVPGHAQENDTSAQTRPLESQQRALEEQTIELETNLVAVRNQMEAARKQLETAAQQFVLLGGKNGTFTTTSVPPGAAWVINDGYATRAQIGVQLVDASGGALVTQVIDGGGAAVAGVQVGDVITSIDGIDLADGSGTPNAELQTRLSALESGATVALIVERGGAEIELEVETQAGNAYTWINQGPSGSEYRVFLAQAAAGAREASAAARGASAEATAAARSARALNPIRVFNFAAAPWGDMELVPMTTALGRYFETTDGLLVVRAPSDASIGLQDGDVILEIGARTPASPEHALRILGSFESGETIAFSLMRDGSRTPLNYTVQENSFGGGGFQIYAPAPSAAPAPPVTPTAP